MPQKGQITKFEAKKIAKIWIACQIRQIYPEDAGAQLSFTETGMIKEAMQDIADKLQGDNDFYLKLGDIVNSIKNERTDNKA